MNFLLPVPQTALGTVDEDGRIIVSREWYRFFGLLVTATGGSTDIIVDGSVDFTGQFSQAIAIISDQQSRIAALEMQIANREEFPYRRIADLEMLMPGPATS